MTRKAEDTLGSRIAYARGVRRKTVPELTKETGLPRTQIGNLEAGRQSWNVKLNTLLALAKALECSVHWLATGDGDPFHVVDETSKQARIPEFTDHGPDQKLADSSADVSQSLTIDERRGGRGAGSSGVERPSKR